MGAQVVAILPFIAFKQAVGVRHAPIALLNGLGGAKDIHQRAPMGLIGKDALDGIPQTAAALPGIALMGELQEMRHRLGHQGIHIGVAVIHRVFGHNLPGKVQHRALRPLIF